MRRHVAAALSAGSAAVAISFRRGAGGGKSGRGLRGAGALGGGGSEGGRGVFWGAGGGVWGRWGPLTCVFSCRQARQRTPCTRRTGRVRSGRRQRLAGRPRGRRYGAEGEGKAIKRFGSASGRAGRAEGVS